MRWLHPPRVGILLGSLILVALGWVLVRTFWPANSGLRNVIADVEGTRVTITYNRGATEAQFSVRLDGLGKYRKVKYEILSSAPLAPSWKATHEGTLSEVLVIESGFLPVGRPMTDDLAEELARSYKISLKADGGDYRSLDFSKASVVRLASP